MKKIGIVVPDINFVGGAEKVAINLYNQLKEDYKVEIISVFKSNIKANPEIDSINIKYMNLNKKRNIFARQVQRLFLFQTHNSFFREYKTIIGNNFFRYYALPFSHNKNIKLIEIQHMCYEEGFRRKGFAYKFSISFRNLIYNRLDNIVVLTNRDKQVFESKGLKNIKCIPNAISSDNENFADVSSKKIIAIGRLTYQKGIDMLLDVWSQIENKDWLLNIYGEGEMRSELEMMIKEKNMERVYLCGVSDNIENKILESSIQVMTSRYEGFPLVILEGIKNGLPVIAFDCDSGPSDIITHGENGFILKLGDIEDFAKKLNFLIENEDKRIEMGRNAKRSSAKYDWKYVIELWKQLLSS